MNYYMARQLKVANLDGGWHYTCMNDGQIWPVGYCAEHAPHATAAAAEECYRNYLLDKKLRLNCEHPDTQKKCQVCGTWTLARAVIDCDIFELCPAHMTRDEVAKLFPAPGTSASSW